MKYIELIQTAFLSYFIMLIVLRILGKKELSQLTLLDFIVFLMMSELMTISIDDDQMTLLHSLCAVLTIVFTDKICSYFSLKNKNIKKLLEGQPCYLIFQGQLNQEKLRALNYSVNDLCHHLRESGVGSLSDVAFAILETDGQLSVIKKNECHYQIPDTMISDGEINEDVLFLLKKDKQWLIDLLKKEGIDDYHTLLYCTLEKEGLYYIKKAR